MVKDALHRHPRSAAHVRVSNKTLDDVIFRQAPVAAERGAPLMTAVIHTLTSEQEHSTGAEGVLERARHGWSFCGRSWSASRIR